VDGANEKTAEPIEGSSTKPLLDPLADPVLEFRRGPLGEGESHDAGGGDGINEQVGHPL
jgi:hypothetical protein